MRIERLNAELNQENTFKKSKGFDDFKGLSLNNNYPMYDNKGYSTLNNLSSDKYQNVVNRQLTFNNNNNFNSTMDGRQTRNGYQVQNEVEIQNIEKPIVETNKTGAFNKKLSGEEEIDFLLMDKNKEDHAIEITNVKNYPRRINILD